MSIVNIILCIVAVVSGVLCVAQMLGYCFDILRQPDNSDFYGEDQL